MAPTVNFIRMMDRWIDMMNSGNLSEAHQKRNRYVAAFSQEDDPRLDWLVNVFLPYFDDWTASINMINSRFQHLPAAERARKQLNQQTLTGLFITTKSIIECVRFLLGKGAAFALTEYFNQGALQRHFGHHHQKGGAKDNPTVFEVCHIINQVRAVSTSGFAPKRGNVRGDVLNVVENAPVPRRRQPPEMKLSTLKTLSCHNANYVITGGTTGCHDNLQCHHWWQSWHMTSRFSVHQYLNML